MKKLASALLLATALFSPGLASASLAREVKVSVDLVNYSGPPAYLAFYLTKPDGSFEKTVWLSGSKPRYLGDLRGWLMAATANGGKISIDGITGASVGSGQNLSISVDLADTMIDAGYVLHVETAVEHGGDYPDDATLPVTTNAEPVAGTGYIRTLSISL